MVELDNSGLPGHVKIVEVGARDGLQNEPGNVTPQLRIELIDRLSAAGLPVIEAGSFVSPKWVPQMASTDEVLAGIKQQPDTQFSVLTPNMRGFDAAMESGCTEVAVFAAASQSFSQSNVNCTIEQSLVRFEPLLAAAKQEKVAVRGYVSCVATCPFEGPIEPVEVAKVAKQLIDMGCYEVSLGDTTGAGSPATMMRMLDAVTERVQIERLAVHCHDTYGQALANILVMLQAGITVVDSSVAGLGGCPYAKGATGNVATEDVLYMLHGLGIHTGVDFEQVITVGNFISERLQRQNQSRVATALNAKRAQA